MLIVNGHRFYLLLEFIKFFIKNHIMAFYYLSNITNIN